MDQRTADLFVLAFGISTIFVDYRSLFARAFTNIRGTRVAIPK